jgi:hypothetical protein
MWNHPYQTAFYILAIVVSIYGSSIRAFLSLPPQKLNIWFLKTRYFLLSAKITNLNKCHQNSCNLTLYIWKTVAPAIILICLFLALISINTALIARILSSHREFTVVHFRIFAVLIMYILIIILPRLVTLTLFLLTLDTFEDYLPILNRKLINLQLRLKKAGANVGPEND